MCLPVFLDVPSLGQRLSPHGIMSSGIKSFVTESVHDKFHDKVHDKVHGKFHDKVHDKVQLVWGDWETSRFKSDSTHIKL